MGGEAYVQIFVLQRNLPHGAVQLPLLASVTAVRAGGQ